ncbi:MAG: AAA family ATPase [Clostridia bacterium]|nr:AAA family ATPase [Clostridia bacterium]
MKQFNTTGLCISSEHYMVDLAERVEEIRKLVDEGKHFTISRPRQYGKTTVLTALASLLSDQYDVISIDFQDITYADFENENEFTKGLSQLLCDMRDNMDIPISNQYFTQFHDLACRSDRVELNDLFRAFDKWCKENQKPIVLIIDEVDTATNNQVFLDFLAQLRSNYLKRQRNPKYKTFQSIILAGVTDVTQLKGKIRSEEDEKENSPWNIAADFTIDMSLSETGIKEMLDEYEADHHTGMNTEAIAKSIREYTNGYPFLVSRICQLIDETVSKTMKLSEAWTNRGFDEALKLLLSENNSLFQSLTKNLNNFPGLKASVRSILMEGTKLTWNAQQDSMVRMQMYGMIKNEHNTVRVANRVFETMLYNLFLSDEELKRNVFAREGDFAKNQFVMEGKLNIRLILERFIVTYTQVCGPLKEHFKEKDGREQFLLYLKPIINGTGNYYIESQTRDQTRTDVIVDYLGQQYIIELKIWHGERYNAEGERQLREYLDYWNLDTGYMLSFNFNKKKEQGVRRIQIGNKVVYEGTV